jgi:uncharacterized membrane protein
MDASVSAATRAVPAPVTPSLPKPARVDSVDLLRGLVMIVMALDHARDFFTNRFYDPADLTHTYPALFFTRIVTHVCAPTFMLLAGTAAQLSLSRGKSRADVARFLLSRGIAFVIAEHTILRLAWTSKIFLFPIMGGTLWGLGWAMIGLAPLVFLPMRWIAVTGALIVLAHNAFDGLTAHTTGTLRYLAVFLHGGFIGSPQQPIMFVGYSIIPWVGVMALGYALGPTLRWPVDKRRRFFFRVGLALTLGFVALRVTNWYGDHLKWSPQGDAVATLMSFVDTEKYPPSLLFLMMTLGPMLMLLSLLERWKGRFAQWVLVYGRVPLFYYFAHIYLLHAMALALAAVMHKPEPWTAIWAYFGPPIADYGWGLGVVYAAWISAVVALYPACKWYLGVKRRSSFWLLGYL